MDSTAFIALFLLFTSSAAAAAAAETLSVYEALQEFDFPIGILPKGATGYELNNSTGDFKAYLGEGTCSFSLEGSYDLKYKSTITGQISKDRLTKLSGVSVKVLFFWFDIVEVRRTGDELEFSVGILSASFGMENFLECPQCGCGLNCHDHQGRNLKLNRFVAAS